MRCAKTHAQICATDETEFDIPPASSFARMRIGVTRGGARTLTPREPQSPDGSQDRRPGSTNYALRRFSPMGAVKAGRRRPKMRRPIPDPILAEEQLTEGLALAGVLPVLFASLVVAYA